MGLTTNLQNARWFGDTDPDSFYPRCYVLGGEEDKDAFVGEEVGVVYLRPKSCHVSSNDEVMMRGTSVVLKMSDE